MMNINDLYSQDEIDADGMDMSPVAAPVAPVADYLPRHAAASFWGSLSADDEAEYGEDI